MAGIGRPSRDPTAATLAPQAEAGIEGADTLLRRWGPGESEVSRGHGPAVKRWRHPTGERLAPRGEAEVSRGQERSLGSWGVGEQERALTGDPTAKGWAVGGCNGGAQRPPCQNCGTTPHILRSTLGKSLPLKFSSLISNWAEMPKVTDLGKDQPIYALDTHQ